MASADVVPGIDLDFTAGAHAPRRFFSAWWSAVWYVERAGKYDLSLGADDRGQMRLDDEVVIERNPSVGLSRHITVTRELSAGPHTIEVDYEQRGGRLFLSAEWAPAGGRAAAVCRGAAVSRRRRRRRRCGRQTRLRWLRVALLGAWLLVLGAVAWRLVAGVRRTIVDDARGWRGVGGAGLDATRDRGCVWPGPGWRRSRR